MPIVSILLSHFFSISYFHYMQPKWYHLTVHPIGYPQPEGKLAYVQHTYDLSEACPTCHIGLRQKAPFRFKTIPKTKTHQWIGLHWVFDQCFVREDVKAVLEQEQISGIHFSSPVLHATGQDLPGWYQIEVEERLTDGLCTDQLSTEICELPKDPAMLNFLKANHSKLLNGPFCGQTKFHYPQQPFAFQMQASAFSFSKDFVRLNHYFGSGGSASQPLLISEKVVQLIQREKWKGAYWKPVELKG